MTTATTPINGNFTLKKPITHKAIQYTGKESLPAIRALFESIGYEPAVVEQFTNDIIEIPGVDVVYGDDDNVMLARIGDVIVVGHDVGFPGTATITVLSEERFQEIFEKGTQA